MGVPDEDRSDSEFWDRASAEVWRELVGRDGYLPVFLLTVLSMVVIQIDDGWRFGHLVSTLTVGATVVMAMVRSRVPRSWLRLAIGLASAAFGVAIYRSVVAEPTDRNLLAAAASILFTMVVALSLPAVLRAAFGHRKITVNTVIAAITAYLLFGLLFAGVYRSVELATSEPFFVQGEGTGSTFAYFSYVTLTTVGFGDYTAATPLGRGLTTLQAVMGQIYLVTTVAVVVSRLGQERQRAAAPPPATSPPAGAPPDGPPDGPAPS